MKKLLALLLSVLLVVGMLAACAPKDNAEDTKPADTKPADTKPADTEPADTEPEIDYSEIDFTIAWWGNDVRAEMTIKMIEEFEKLYPGLKVNVDYIGNTGDYQTKLTTYASGGDLPDVMQVTYSMVPTFARNGMITSLEPYFESGAIDTSKLDMSANSACTFEGAAYALATGVNAPCLIYDPSYLEEAGVTMSFAPSIEEYYEVAKAVYEKTGAKADGMSHIDYFRSAGGDVYATEGNAMGFTAEDLEGYLRLSSEGENGGFIHTQGDESTGSTGADIGAGYKWVAGGTWTNLLESMEAESGRTLELAYSPYLVGGNENHVYMQPTMAWAVAETSSDVEKELAAAFINFFSNSEVVYEICGTNRGVPLSSDMKAYLVKDATPSFQKVVDYLNYLADGHTTPMNTNAPEFQADAMAIYTDICERWTLGMIADEDLTAECEKAVEAMNEALQGK